MLNLRKPSFAGMTLLEIIITSALFLVLGSLFVWFLVTTSQITAQGSARVNIQQRAALLTRRIQKDLEMSSRKAIAIYSQAQASPGEPIVVASIPIQDVDPEGQKVFAREVVGYFWDRSNEALYFRSWPPKTSPSSFAVEPLPADYAYRISDSELLQFAAGDGVELADRVVNFDTEWIGNAVTLKLAIEEDVAGKQAPLRFDYEKVFTIRH